MRSLPHFQASHVNVIARSVCFVVAVATKMQQIQFIDQTFFFQKFDGAIDGDQVYAGINLPFEIHQENEFTT